MAQFIISVIGDVLRHIAIKVAECGYVGRIASLNSSQLVVLLPQISLYDFRCRCEPQEGGIAFGQLACAPRSLRKALGARRKQILSQFLIESSMLCALGGVLGLLAAAGISWGVTVLTPITMTITVGYILLALGVSKAVGMVAGIYPAFKASRLDPIIALTKTT